MKKLKKVFANALLGLVLIGGNAAMVFASAEICPQTAINPSTGQTCTLDSIGISRDFSTWYCNYVC